MSENELRDFFAGAALQGIVASAIEQYGFKPELMARDSYKIADAMMKARKTQSDEEE